MSRQPVSVIIVSYNDRMIMRRCLSALSAQLDVPGDEIIVVDNASTDGVLEDLRRMDIRLIENAENVGFPLGCNIGYDAAAPGNDIFLLNNDAVLAEGALKNLCRALYSAEDVGAVGAVSNNALEQIEPGIARDVPLEEALRFGAKLNRKDVVYEYRSRLTGFAVLLKRAVVDRLMAEDGYFLDPRFSPGYFEDEDLGVRVALAGYRQILCHNAFIYHKGGTGFASHPEAMERGQRKFIDKWGFDIWAYIGILDDYEEEVRRYLNDINNGEIAGSKVSSSNHEEASDADRPDHRRIPAGSPLRILELNCGMGVNLAYLQYLHPGISVIGIEPSPQIAQIAATLIDVICEDPEEALENAAIPDTPEASVLQAASYDLIFAGDAVSHSKDPDRLRTGLMKLLKPNGQLIEVE